LTLAQMAGEGNVEEMGAFVAYGFESLGKISMCIVSYTGSVCKLMVFRENEAERFFVRLKGRTVRYPIVTISSL
jgi:hypothetical protein